MIENFSRSIHGGGIYFGIVPIVFAIAMISIAQKLIDTLTYAKLYLT